ncbi:YELLOW STRIPE like 7 [Actinidia rufa]|uniref:YELLOW STRIPE like 7 n=1 Tax=Actinidia rufa TaxID=165716 RepID=A0A7J0GF96_9ERIC|nr:YELLOW STRIPE like 7 [Actinidia rufa]
MSEIIAKQLTEANDAQNIKNPTLGWMIGFLFVVSFRGLFSVVLLRKIMIIDYKLIYPSGIATAHLINSFHTPQGTNLEKFYFDFSATYVGVGMICPYLINVSLLVGAILSWGIMWPLIHEKRGNWYSAELKSTSLDGLQVYRVLIGIAMILGDGLYNFVKVLGHTLFGLYRQLRDKDQGSFLPVGGRSPPQMLLYLMMITVGLNSFSRTTSQLVLWLLGFSALPKHCLTLSYAFFIGAVVINAIKDVVGKEKAKFIPIPMAMAIPFYIGSYFAIDMFVGSMILFVWSKINKAKADAFGPAVASGLICGDGMWILVSSILALAGVNPPICMKFLSRKTNTKVVLHFLNASN